MSGEPNNPTEKPQSALDGLRSLPQEKDSGLKIILWAGITLVVLLGIYVAFQLALANKVPQGTTAAGIQLGGISQTQAQQRLTQETTSLANKQLQVQAGGQSMVLRPGDLGLQVDAAATLQPVTGFTLSPKRLWQHLTSGPELQVVTSVAEPDASVVQMALRHLEITPQNGGVSFVSGRVITTAPTPGQQVNPEDLLSAVSAGWLTQTQVQVATQEVPAVIDQEQVDRAAALADTLVAGPVRLNVGKTFVELPANTIVPHASFVPQHGELVLQIDGDGLTPEIISRLPVGVLTDPVNAGLIVTSGKPVVRPGKAGSQIDTVGLSQAITKALGTSQRAAALPIAVLEPQITTQSVVELGIAEKVSSFSTVLSGNSARISNITLGAKYVDGHIILPGETFSLDKVLGPSTPERGFKSAGAIIDGVLQETYGGGLSQLTTTIYNAAFFAGLEDVEHRPHSMYFSRYPEGREATLSRPQLDLKFTNDTPYGMLLRAYVSGGRLHIELWSTPYYRVETQTSKRSNVVPAKTIISTSASCVAQAKGSPGFSVTVYRQVFLDKKQVKDQEWTWRYNPQNEIICQKDQAPTPPTGEPQDPEDTF